MDKIKTFFKKNNCLISFAVGAVCMYMILSYAGVLRTGKYCILEGDLFEIYVPVIRNFCRNILHGQSIYYSWNNSLGMNTSVMLSFYGAFNPFNILYLIFYKADPNIITALTVILKAGLAALSFQLFEKKVLKIDGLMSVVFSVLYALCSFQVAYGIVNIIWTDALYVLPLVFISLYVLREKGNPIPLTLSYAYIFIVQPYMGFVIGVFSFIYFIISIFLTERKVSLYKYILGFVVSVVNAILLSSVTWLPALFQLRKSSIASAEGFISLGINPLDVYNQLFFGNNNSIVECMPNIYCGVLSLILLPIFFTDKKNDLKSKIKGGILLLILVLSCVILPLYKVWCAFDAPDGWPFRFSFCLSFVIVTLATIEAQHLKDINYKVLFAVAGIDVAVYILEIFLLRRANIIYSINNYLYLLINIGIILVWIGAIYLVKKNAEDEKKANVVGLFFVLLVVFECVGNGFSSYYKGDNYYTVPETNETQFYSWYENQKQLTEYIKKDNSFFRVNFMADYLYNSDSFTGYNGLSDFSTSENIHVRETLGKMGFAATRKVTRNFGITPVTKMLLGVKYDADCYLPYAGSDIIPPLRISNNPYALSLGYMVDDDVSDFSFESGNAFENLNNLVSSMTGEENTIFEEIDKDKLSIEEDGVILEQGDNGYVFKNTTGEYDSFISFVADSDIQNDELYIYFDNYSSELYGYSMIAMDGFENRHEGGGVLSRSYIKPFETYNDFNVLSKRIRVLATGVIEQGIKDYYIARLNEVALYNTFDQLSDEQLVIDKLSNTNIKGNVEVKNDNEILFTTIPYDECWNVKVDGNNTEITPLLDDAFIGVRLPKGNHNIEFSYKVSGLKGGTTASLIGVLIFALMIVFVKLPKGKEVKEQ
jgi:uncharacterized membrane protein YfhO